MSSLGVWPIAVPLMGAVLTFLWRRHAPWLGFVTAAITALSAAAVVVDVWTRGAHYHPIGGWEAPLGIALRADGLTALMLATTAVVGVAVSVYATAYFAPAEQEEDEPKHVFERVYFWPLWLFLWAALDALFLSNDAFNLYVTLELIGLSAVALTALTGRAEAVAAALRYLLVSMIGSLSYLLGVALLYNTYAVLDLDLLAQAVRPEPITHAALALMTVGLLLKTALFPLHFWLPPAHANAPAPVSAVLSGLVVKASFYLLLRWWFEVFGAVGASAVADLLGLLGALAIVWGSVQALRQERLKTLIAYSTVAQLGYLLLLFPLAQAGPGSSAWNGAVYFVISHACAKSALFLAAGTIMHTAGHDRLGELPGLGQRLPVTMLALSVAGASLLGVPPSGGFVAKWLLLTAAFTTGQWWWALVIIGGSLLAAGYVFRMVVHAFTPATWIAHETPVAARLEWTALVLAGLAVVLGTVATTPLALLAIGTSAP